MNWYRLSKSFEEPWTLTQEEFLGYHNTGFIPSDFYKDCEDISGLSWLGPKDKYPILYSIKRFGDKDIEFRKTGRRLRYVKVDERENIVRDSNGMAIMMNEEEMKQHGLPLEDTGITAFDGNTVIAFASDEFGTDGIWVAKPYQGLGIGTYLTIEFRKQFSAKRRMGQMTNAGYNLAKSVHKRYVQEALESGRVVPPEVLKDYPDLLSEVRE